MRVAHVAASSENFPGLAAAAGARHHFAAVYAFSRAADDLPTRARAAGTARTWNDGAGCSMRGVGRRLAEPVGRPAATFGPLPCQHDTMSGASRPSCSAISCRLCQDVPTGRTPWSEYSTTPRSANPIGLACCSPAVTTNAGAAIHRSAPHCLANSGGPRRDCGPGTPLRAASLLREHDAAIGVLDHAPPLLLARVIGTLRTDRTAVPAGSASVRRAGGRRASNCCHLARGTTGGRTRQVRHTRAHSSVLTRADSVSVAAGRSSGVHEGAS